MQLCYKPISHHTHCLSGNEIYNAKRKNEGNKNDAALMLNLMGCEAHGDMSKEVVKNMLR